MSIRLVWLIVLAMSLSLMTYGDDKTDDAKKIQGTWHIIAEDSKGKERPEVEVKGTPVIITATTITVKDDENNKNWVMTYELDPKSKPHKVIKLELHAGTDQKQATKGIYHLEGDELKICYAMPEHETPTEFKAEPGKYNHFLMRRVKEHKVKK